MARKTKADTEYTRRQIIAAARKVFAERGVSRSTLAQIAAAAGVTRGAIYWHFANKPELFFAMREQVLLPLIDQVDENLLVADRDDPLQDIQSSMVAILNTLENDETTRTTFEIIAFKCEYVDEFLHAHTQPMKAACNFKQKLLYAYASAQRKGQLLAGSDPVLLALDSYVFIKGLINLWLSDPDGTNLRAQAPAIIGAHIALRRRREADML